MTIRVLLADDHSVLRDGLAALLEAQDAAHDRSSISTALPPWSGSPSPVA